MPMPRIAALSIAAIVAFGTLAAFADDIVVDPAIASMTADQKVDARQALMKDNGGTLKSLFSGAVTGDAAVAAATKLVQNFTNLPALFADGATNDKSEALPLIWTEFDKFTAESDKAKALAVALVEAVKTGDAAAIGAAAKPLGGVCGECHQTYRKPQG